MTKKEKDKAQEEVNSVDNSVGGIPPKKKKGYILSSIFQEDGGGMFLLNRK